MTDPMYERMCAAFVATILCILHASDASASPKVRVRGAARIDARGARADGRLELAGILTDDAGLPIANQVLSATIARATAPGAPLPFDDRSVVACTISARMPAVEGEGNVHVVTDEAGRFCVRLGLAVDRYVAHVTFPGSTLVDGAGVDVPVDLARRAIALSFDPEPRVVWLGAGPIAIEAMATIVDEGIKTPAARTPLALTNEQGTLLSSATTNALGRARFQLDSATAGTPGRGELRVAFAGSADVAAGSHAADVERHARVALTVPSAKNGVLEPGSPEEGVSLLVEAHAAGAAISGGSVEVRVDGVVVGAAPVERGESNVVLSFAPGTSDARGVSVALRYAPSAPWLEPGPELSLRLPIRGPSPWRQLPLVAAGVAVLAWFVAGRLRRSREAAAAAPRVRPQARGEAKLDVVTLARNAHDGWTGRVTDAHDGTPLEAARVAIERPEFGTAKSIATTLTDERGAFTLRAEATRPGDELAIESTFHEPLRRPLPHAGDIDAQLVSRKRALLGRLVDWAKGQGRPFDARPEPTPAHVRKAAGRDFAVARWADAVEQAAFAGSSIDAHAEADVDRLAPKVVSPTLVVSPADRPPAQQTRPRK